VTPVFKLQRARIETHYLTQDIASGWTGVQPAAVVLD
jgi:hypothetical protein